MYLVMDIGRKLKLRLKKYDIFRNSNRFDYRTTHWWSNFGIYDRNP
jgi:hypothetical protein